MVVLPELCSIEYSRCSFGRLDDLAEPLDGPSFRAWQSISSEFHTYVAYSFPRRTTDGYRITLAVTGPDGRLVGHYDKIYLAQFGASTEKDFFQPGNNLFVFEVNEFRLGAIICADIRMPEIARTLTVDHGVEVILHCSTYSRDPTFYSWHHFAVTRALENQVYLLSINRAGEDYGKSILCPPWVDENCPPIWFDEHGEQFKKLVIERTEIELARKYYSFLKDRQENLDVQLPGFPLSTHPHFV